MSQLQDALAAAAAGDKSKAYVMLAELLKQSPNDVDAWVALSDIVDDEKQKRTFLTRALTLNSNHAEAKQKLLYLDTPPEARAPEAEPEPEPAPEPEPEPELEHPVTILEPTPAMDETMMMPPEKVEELRLQSGIGSDDTMVDMRPVSSDAGDFEAQAAGDTIPPWLMGEDGAILDEVEAVEAAVAEPTDESVESTPVPDWLKDEDEVVWEEESAPAVPESEPLSTREMAALQEAEGDKPAPRRRRSNAQLEKLFYWLIFAFVIVGLLFVYLVWLNVDAILEVLPF